MIKPMKKVSLAFIALSALSLPGVSQAAGDNIIGTQVWGQLSGGGASATSGLAGSVMNVYYQGQLSDSTAWTGQFMTDAGLNVYGAAYKAYLGGEYANSPYWSAGIGIWDFAGLASATTLNLGVGYDMKAGSNFVVGLDAVYAYSLDTGGSITNIGVNVGYMF